MSEAKAEVSEAEEVKDAEGTDGSATEGGENAPKSGGKTKLILMIAIPIVLLGIVAGVLFLTPFGKSLIGLDTEEAGHEKVEEPKLPENIAYYELPEMLVNIQAGSAKRKPYLRLALKLEVTDPEAVKTLDLIKPRIIDSFQVYLRELRVEDLEGSAGSQRLKEELLKRANHVTAPIKVTDVLFQVFVVQ